MGKIINRFIKIYFLFKVNFIVILLAGCVGSSMQKQKLAKEESSIVLNGVSISVPKLNKQPVSTSETIKIEALIKSLNEINKPDIGYSPTLSGSNFPPLNDYAQLEVIHVSNHDLKRNNSVKQLVELGPKALPLLIKHLADDTPTKLVITHDGFFGGMWYGKELPYNPISEKELKAHLSAGFSNTAGGDSISDSQSKNIKSHTVNIGDLCFTIIGMITNRSYQSVRYQPTACTVINSPVNEPILAKALIAMWNKIDCREELFRHLLIDFYTHGENNYFQDGAAIRLLYYFPNESASIILERLDSFSSKMNDENKEQLNRNNIEIASFIKSIAWSKISKIRKAIQRIVANSTEVDVVLNGIPALENLKAEPFFQKLNIMLLKSNGNFEYPSQTPQDLLNSIFTIFPKRISEVLNVYISNCGREGLINSIYFMYTSEIDLAPKILKNYLNDFNTGIGSYTMEIRSNYEHINESDYLPMRIKDNAYVLICRALGDKDAVCFGSPKKMDELINVLFDRLSTDNKNIKFTKNELIERAKERQYYYKK